MANCQSLVGTRLGTTRCSDINLPSLKDAPPQFVKNFESRSNQFSKLDNKYAHKSCGEFLGSREHGLRKQTNGAILHKSDNIISWDNSVEPERYISRTRGTYTAPPLSYKSCPPMMRRFPRKAIPASPEYTLATTTSCWQPDPNHQSLTVESITSSLQCITDTLKAARTEAAAMSLFQITMYKVLAETQHRLKKPNTWRYSTHPDYKLSELRKR